MKFTVRGFRGNRLCTGMVHFKVKYVDCRSITKLALKSNNTFVGHKMEHAWNCSTNSIEASVRVFFVFELAQRRTSASAAVMILLQSVHRFPIISRSRRRHWVIHDNQPSSSLAWNVIWRHGIRRMVALLRAFVTGPSAVGLTSSELTR